MDSDVHTDQSPRPHKRLKPSKSTALTPSAGSGPSSAGLGRTGSRFIGVFIPVASSSKRHVARPAKEAAARARETVKRCRENSLQVIDLISSREPSHEATELVSPLTRQGSPDHKRRDKSPATESRQLYERTTAAHEAPLEDVDLPAKAPEQARPAYAVISREASPVDRKGKGKGKTRNVDDRAAHSIPYVLPHSACPLRNRGSYSPATSVTVNRRTPSRSISTSPPLCEQAASTTSTTTAISTRRESSPLTQLTSSSQPLASSKPASLTSGASCASVRSRPSASPTNSGKAASWDPKEISAELHKAVTSVSAKRKNAFSPSSRPAALLQIPGSPLQEELEHTSFSARRATVLSANTENGVQDISRSASNSHTLKLADDGEVEQPGASHRQGASSQQLKLRTPSYSFPTVPSRLPNPSTISDASFAQPLPVHAKLPTNSSLIVISDSEADPEDDEQSSASASSAQTDHVVLAVSHASNITPKKRVIRSLSTYSSSSSSSSSDQNDSDQDSLAVWPPLPQEQDDSDDLDYNDAHHRQIKLEKQRMKQPKRRRDPSADVLGVKAARRSRRLPTTKSARGVISGNEPAAQLKKAEQTASLLTKHNEETDTDSDAPLLQSRPKDRMERDNSALLLSDQEQAYTTSATSSQNEKPHAIDSSTARRPVKYTRSRTALGASDTLLCHQCEVYLPKEKVLHCVSCDRGLCDNCISARYITQKEYAAVILYISFQWQNKNPQTGGDGPASKDIGCSSLPGFDISNIDFQCPVCKAICNCANCIRGPYPRPGTVRNKPTRAQLLQETGRDLSPVVDVSQKSLLAMQGQATRQQYQDEDAAFPPGTPSQPPSHLSTAAQYVPTTEHATSRPIKVEKAFSVGTKIRIKLGPKGKKVRTIDYEDPLQRAQARRAAIDEETDFVPNVSARKRPSGPMQNNSVPRLGSPPRVQLPRLCETDIGYVDVPEVKSSTARIRLATTVGQQLGRSPASLQQSTGDKQLQGNQIIPLRSNEPIFTLSEEVTSDTKLPLSELDLTSHGFALGTTDLSSTVLTSGSAFRTSRHSGLASELDDSVIPDFFSGHIHAVPDLDYKSPSADGQTTPSLPSPRTTDDVPTTVGSSTQIATGRFTKSPFLSSNYLLGEDAAQQDAEDYISNVGADMRSLLTNSEASKLYNHDFLSTPSQEHSLLDDSFTSFINDEAFAPYMEDAQNVLL